MNKTKKNVIFFAADDVYFKRFGVDLISSAVEKNKNWRVFVHVYNPTDESVAIANGFSQVTLSTEILDEKYFSDAVLQLKKMAASGGEEHSSRIERICKTIKAHDRNIWFGILAKLVRFDTRFFNFAPEKPLRSYLKKVYFSCKRFIVLEQLCSSGEGVRDVLALDADSVFNAGVIEPLPYSRCDVAIKHRTSTKGQSFLAGAIYLPENGKRKIFLKELANQIEVKFSGFELEWGLDQILLNKLVPSFEWRQLDNRLGDLDFNSDSWVWLAKGNTKDMLKSICG